MLNKLSNEWNTPDDHCKQRSSFDLVSDIVSKLTKVEQVLDLGCGVGNSFDFFNFLCPEAEWTGLDIDDSPEVVSRIKKNDSRFHSFDGINIPFEDNSFDIIFSNQVLEHVRYPVELLKEVCRVLGKNGYFVGSTSHLEPYHSYSVRNYTPFGFRLLLEDADMKLDEIRPGIDSLTLILRLGLGRPKFFSRWGSRESPLNRIINLFGKLSGKSIAEINVLKLIFCGQFAFIARKN